MKRTLVSVVIVFLIACLCALGCTGQKNDDVTRFFNSNEYSELMKNIENTTEMDVETELTNSNWRFFNYRKDLLDAAINDFEKLDVPAEIEKPVKSLRFSAYCYSESLFLYGLSASVDDKAKKIDYLNKGTEELSKANKHMSEYVKDIKAQGYDLWK